MSDYLAGLRAALEANAARVAKPARIDIPNIGTFYVRPRLMEEYEAAQNAVAAGDRNAIAFSVARVLCDESGARFPEEVRDQLAALLAKQPESVVIAIGNAADGNPPPGN